MYFNMAAVCKRNVMIDSLNWQEKRSDVREKSSKGKYVRSSLQPLTENNDVLLMLESFVKVSKEGTQKKNVARGLRSVQEILMYGCGFLPFEEAFHLFSSFFVCSPDRQAFRDKLLDPVYGLSVYIVTQPITSLIFVVLKNNTKMEEFLDNFTGMLDEDSPNRDVDGLRLDCSTLKILIKSMDTEYDKNVLRTVVALCHTRHELYDLCIDPTSAKRHIYDIVEVANTCDKALIAGEDLVRNNLIEKQAKIQLQMKGAESTLAKKRDIWPQKRVADLEETMEVLQEKLCDVESQLNQTNKAAVEKTRRAAKRQAESLLERNRVKRRRLGAQRPVQIDEDEEEFLLKAVEDMSTAHGRRHDTVMYLHHRVKAKDMLRIVNHRRVQKGKRPLKAVSTVLARGKPKRANSIQAKRHLGQSLFCCKKPPKTEESETELTHHQRAHVKNAVEDFCFNEEDRKYALIKSIDDKAYVRPGTSVGLRDVRRGGIYQPTDSDAARKLPKYDWVTAEVYITPSTHRVFTKEPKTVGSKEAYIMSEDESFVFMRPKAHVGSSGSVWSSEDFELRTKRPDLFEVSGSGSSLTVPFRSFCTRVKDKVKHFIETTTEADVMAITSHPECQFKGYERKRLEHTSDYLENSVDMANVNSKMTEEEVQHCCKVQGLVQLALSIMNSLPKSANTGVQLWSDYQVVIGKSEQILQLLDELKLPLAKPRVLELTDAGPGVGCNNGAVQYRMAEQILIHGLDKVVRVHRARGDSGQNEAERTNASIGEALVTGETLNWEYHQRFEGMTKSDIEALSLQDYEQLEEQRMEKNAWRAAAELAERVDGEPAPSGFLNCSVTPTSREQFLWDKGYLENYMSCKTECARMKLPGHGYYSKLERFCKLHFKRGELYIEYVKGSCEEAGELCEFCKTWKGPRTGPVPRPYPDHSKPGFHYLAARKTPVCGTNGNARPIDDFQPRARLKELHGQGKLSSSDEEQIKELSENYIVPENLLRNYILHLEHLVLMKEKRVREDKARKEAREEKKYEDYSWQDLYQNKKISSLRVMELDKYLAYHSLTARAQTIKKKDKVSLVEAHIAMKHFSDVTKGSELDEELDNEEDDVVICEWGTTQTDEDVNVFCLCRQPEDERFMVCCDKCDEWFHAECINMSEEEIETYMDDPDLEFICQLCIVT